jgi:hypothetical protein
MANSNLSSVLNFVVFIFHSYNVEHKKRGKKNIFSFAITHHCQCALVKVSVTLIVAFYESKPLLQASMHQFVLNYVVFAFFCVFNRHLLPQFLAQRCENWCASTKFSGKQVSVLIFFKLTTQKLTLTSVARKQTPFRTHFFTLLKFGGDVAFLEKLLPTKFQFDISNGFQMARVQNSRFFKFSEKSCFLKPKLVLI